jgi:malate synthase
MITAQPIIAEKPKVRGVMSPNYAAILTPEALEFIEALERRFDPRRRELLALRIERQHRFDAGEMPHFLPETKAIREAEWKVAPIPPDLLDRRVEITGPPERKMLINALNSGAKCYMTDFEDSSSPTWETMLDGQVNVRDAVRGTIEYTSPEGKHYTLKDKTATLIVRPRGWHMSEKNVVFNEEPISASLFDFGLFFFHNARALIDKGTAPYFYLPKMESHLEARLWNEVFIFAQKALGIPHGTIRATVLIETVPAL